MPAADIVVRPAIPSDWPAIAELLRANSLPLDGAERHLATFRVVSSSGQLFGVAGAEIYGDVALLRSVAVASGQRSQGIGRTIVSAVLDDLSRNHVQRVFLLTTTAMAYFDRLGFVTTPRDQAPVELGASVEFRGACPESARLMSRSTQEG